MFLAPFMGTITSCSGTCATILLGQQWLLLLPPAGLFFSDLVKSCVLGAVFIPPLVAAFTYILQRAGPWVPLQLWAFVLVRTLTRRFHT